MTTEIDVLESELIIALTKVYGEVVVNSISKAQLLHEIGAMLVSRKWFGNNGDSPNAKLNLALDNFNKVYPIK